MTRAGIHVLGLGLCLMGAAGCNRTSKRSQPSAAAPAAEQPSSPKAPRAKPPDEQPAPPSKAEPAGDETVAPSGPRVALVSAAHPHHDRLEGISFDNDCEQDDDCHTGGCSDEICSAEQGVSSTCEVLPVEFPPGSACGCVDGTCRWWHASETLPTPGRKKQPHSGVADKPGGAVVECGGKRCKPGEECIEYYGIAGPSGPKLEQCGIPCDPVQSGKDCPSGMRCVTIADGPGPVCR